MTASAAYRSHTQLWSDLLVALGGSEASLRRHLSERQFLFEILDVLGGTSSSLVLGGRASIMKAIVAAAGGSVSPNHVSFNVLLAQLVVELGGDAISPAYNSTAQLLAAAVNAAADTGGGGGGAPDWVPANAKIYIDLIAPGRAWTEDDGEVAIDTLLGTDANTENGWSATSYDAGNLTADGYVADSGSPFAFIGSARTQIMDAATVRIMLEQPVDADRPGLVLTSADGNDAIVVRASAQNPTRNLNSSSYNGPLNQNIDDILNAGVGAKNAIALTITSNRLDIVANGATALTSALLDADRPAANPLVAALVTPSGHAIQSITIYDALPSTAGLSALSATGV